MFCQPPTDTESPNHWWAFSWTITDVVAPEAQKPAPNVGRVWFSSAKLIVSGGTTVPPRASNGYGPNSVLSQSVISAVRSTLACGPSRQYGVHSWEHAVYTRRAAAVVSVVMSYWPTVRNVR